MADLPKAQHMTRCITIKTIINTNPAVVINELS